MERFYNKNDDDDDQEPFFDSYEDEENDEEMTYIDQQGLIDVMQLDLAKTELNHQLLDRAVNIARQSWFWCFKSANTRMKEIEKIYKSLVKLTDKDK